MVQIHLYMHACLHASALIVFNVSSYIKYNLHRILISRSGVYEYKLHTPFACMID